MLWVYFWVFRILRRIRFYCLGVIQPVKAILSTFQFLLYFLFLARDLILFKSLTFFEAVFCSCS